MKLNGIIARAASAEERREGRWFEPVPTSTRTLDEREASFVAAAANGDTARFQELLDARDLDRDAFRRGLHDVVVKNGGPCWARAFRRVMRKAFGSAAHDEHSTPVGAALAPWVRATVARIERAAPALAAVRDDVRALAQARFFSSTAYIVADALRTPFGTPAIAAVQERWSQREPWLALFDRYPAAARVFALVFEHTCSFTVELVRRLHRDERAIADTFFDGRPLGRLASIDGGAGDTHDRGRAVALLTFEDGRRVVYKPRDLRIGAWALELLGDTRQATLVRDGYVWDRFIEPAPCRDVAEVDAYYMRVGRHLRLLQLIEGRDFHHENILPAGGHPALIDLETLLQPRYAPAPDADPLAVELNEQHEESALPIGILPMLVLSEAGARGVDLGALAPPRSCEAPFKMPALSEHLDRVQAYARFDVGESAPVLDGRRVDAIDHLDEVRAGYEAMDRELRARRLGCELSESARDLPVRMVYRATQIYARLLAGSVMPKALRDGLTRDAWLHRLFKGYLANKHGIGVYEAELRALRRLDIPVFFSRPGSDALILDGGGEVPGFFEGTACERLEQRLADLACSDEPARHDLEIVDTALALREGDGAFEPRHDAPRPACWLDPAVEIGDFILSRAVRGDRGAIGWLGVNYVPWADQWSLGPLDAHVFSGTAGLALLFADLASATGLDRFHVAARGCVQPLVNALDTLPEAYERLRRQPRPQPFYCGYHYGIGGQLAALRRVAPAAFARMRATIPWDLVEARAPVDFISGAAGLAVALGEAPAVPDRPLPYPPGCDPRDLIGTDDPDTARARLAAYREHGTWFPESRRADAHNLSVVFGIGGIAHDFIRLAQPGRFASLRRPSAPNAVPATRSA